MHISQMMDEVWVTIIVACPAEVMTDEFFEEFTKYYENCTYASIVDVRKFAIPSVDDEAWKNWKLVLFKGSLFGIWKLVDDLKLEPVEPNSFVYAQDTLVKES